MQYFIHRHSRQASGLEGPNLKVQAQQQVEDHTKAISQSDIMELANDSALVISYWISSQGDP